MIVMLGGDDCIPVLGFTWTQGFFPYKKWMDIGSTHRVWPQGLRVKIGQGPGPDSVGRVIPSGFASRGIKLRPLDKPIPGKVPEMTCPIFGYNFRAWGWRIGFFFVIDSKKKRRFCEGLLPNNFLDQEHLLSLVGMEVANSCREGWGNHWRCGEKDLKGHGELSGKYRYYSNCLVVDLVAKESLFLFNLGLCVPNQTWLDLSTSVLMAQFSSVNLLSRMLIQGGHLPVRSRVIAIKLYL